jgi:formamidopyrimidine-DNA glycosylase
MAAPMPELPDIVVYLEHIERLFLGQPLERLRIASPFLLRTVEPRPAALEGRRLERTRRLGKRIVLGLEGDLYLVLHLMVAGRLHLKPSGAAIPGRLGLAALDFPSGTLVLTEAGSKRRAALHLAEGEALLRALDRGGVEPLEASAEEFAAALACERHTLRRALTDPRLFSGIGGAFSDEILHRARLSPVVLTSSLGGEEVARLHAAARAVLLEWTDRLRRETAGAFPEKVTAFREGMAVHGRYRMPCPVCGAAVQRIVHAQNETNYCPACQTGGRLLRDRALSRLLHDDWPASPEELEELKGSRSAPPPPPATSRSDGTSPRRGSRRRGPGRGSSPG